ncbi:SH3 domain-binding protein 5-like [Strongylocentrotus purpuratus]|uniref:SH3 domain-binding protein 5 homolog n=1 Tax=Strongylocentrotus purpuratus TaxID=7668 RepID=A0A7M7P6E0_STRPU|nr:SH3 domain-binding protein 5-like [Strongylocentrotus purpuratus]
MSESSMDSNNGAVLDPRIKDELELLNTASAEINRLEKQLDESRQAFRQTLTESTQSLNEKIKKCRKSAQKAQGYYAAKEEARKAQELAQEAALRYQRSSGMYSAARETIGIAEEAALNSKKQPMQDSRRRFDSALQEMLNLSTEKLNAAEREKRESQHEHEKRSKHYITTQQEVDKLAKKFKRSIGKSADYYDLKKSFFYELNDLKIRTEALQSALTESKAKYRGALKHLEQISDDIHQSRQVAVILAGSRQSGVGAETERDSEHEKLDITFHIDDSTDGESVITDSSEPSSCASSTSRMQSRSISGSSLPSPAEWDNDNTNNRFNFAVGSNPESNNGHNGNSKRDSVPKIYMETVDDVEDDDDDDDDGDIFIGVDIDSDSDNDTKGRLDVTRKLRTISIGDLKSFSVYDDGETIDINSSTTADESNRSDTTSNQTTSEQVGDQTVNESSNTPVHDALNDSVDETNDETITEIVDGDVPSQPEKKDDVADTAVDDKANDEVVWI